MKNVVASFIKMERQKPVFKNTYVLDAKNTVSETTNTIIYCSKLSFEVWSNVIDCLLNGFSIRRIAEENNISILTSFRIRHKILMALTRFIDNIELPGEMQSNEKYFSINLKGTKPNKMPRFSKKGHQLLLNIKE